MYLKTSEQSRAKLGFGDQSINWGMHVAGLYETDEERDYILFSFLKQGCLDGDFQLYCPAEENTSLFKENFLNHCPNHKSYLEDPDHFSIHSPKELYYPNGTFSPWTMEEKLEEFFHESQRNGKRNIRASSDMKWALNRIPGIEYLMAYESRLNYFIPGKPWISICLYNTGEFDDTTIMSVLRTHPFVINEGRISMNTLYQDPVIWLKENAPQFI